MENFIMNTILLKYSDVHDQNYKKDFTDTLRVAISIEFEKSSKSDQELKMYSYQEL